MKLRTVIRVPRNVNVPLVTAGAVTLGLLLYRLGSLAPRLSPTEQSIVAASHSISTIVASPLFAPMKLLLWLTHFAPAHFQVLASRLPSVLLALIALGAFIFILHEWHGRRTTVFGFFLFVTAAGYLHIARFTSFDIVYLAAMLTLLATHISVQNHKDNVSVWFIWLAANTLFLFAPGLIWFVILSVIWQWRAISNAWQRLNIVQRIISVVLPLLGMGVIVQGIVRTPRQLFTWLGIPSQVSALRDLPHALLNTLSSIGFRSPMRPEQWLGQLPLLDIFTLAMALAGIVFYALHWRASRTHQLASYLALSLILISFGTASISLILPLLYLFAAAGIAYVLHFWLKKFPHNPIARFTGLSIMAAIIALACYYNLLHYFVAWPHNPETVAVYQAKK